MKLRKRLGEILIDMGFVTRQTLEQALRRQEETLQVRPSPDRLHRDRLVSEARLAGRSSPFLGEMFIDLGVISREQLGEALERQRKSMAAYQKLDKEKLTRAIEIGFLVNSRIGLSELLKTVMQQLNSVTESCASTLMLRDEKTGELVFSVPTGSRGDRLTDVRIPPGKGVAGWVAENDESLLVPEAAKDPRFYPEIDKMTGMETKSILCVPLKANTRVIGVLEVINKADGTVFTEQDALLLDIFANQVAMAVENARVYRELQEGQLALGQSERTLRSIMDALPSAAFLIDEKGNIVEANKTFVDKYGATLEEIRGRSILSLSPEGFLTKTMDKAMQVLSTRETLHFEEAKEGRHYLTTISPAIDSGGRVDCLAVFSQDITGQKKMDELLRQGQKMEAVGTLAGGIAHDFNNILAIIVGNTELALGEIPQSNPAREYLEAIQSAAMRAKDAVQQILTFARRDTAERKPVQMHPIIADSVKLLGATIPSDVEIHQDLSCKYDTVSAHPTQISQVLLNICTNAAQAMGEDGGVLEIRLENADFEDPVEAVDLHPGRYVKLTVTDTGHGIDPGILERVFDPYFTTRGLTGGTGLGLSVVHGIVKDLGGAVNVTTAIGKGTTFEVFIPSLEGSEPGALEKEKPLPAGDEHILFVDDEEGLTKAYTGLLKGLGYDIVSFTDPLKALKAFQEAPESFDLVITDMSMPRMRGDRLASEVMQIRPDIPIILCSGYSDRLSEDEAADMGIRAFAMKPLGKKDLAVTVRKVLDGKD